MAGLSQPQDQGGNQQSFPPELLMALLSHLASGGSRQGTPVPKDGSQTSPLSTLLPSLLQALLGQNTPPMQQSSQQGQGLQQQGQAQQQEQAQGSPQNTVMQLLQSLGLKI